MKVSFRQGIIRYQRDVSGLATFLKKNDLGSTIDLVTINEPLTVTFAYKKANYLHEEAMTVPRAWTGFSVSFSYWLYIDIDLVTARRSFGSTLVQPAFGLTPPKNLVVDQHWFDVGLMTMKVWNGTAWIERARVFVGAYANGSVLSASQLGSQVGVNTSNEAGFILYGADGMPVRQNQDRKSFEFATTSTIFNTVTAKAINVSLDAIASPVKAAEPIPAYRLVSRDSSNLSVPGVVLADSTIRGRYAVGIVQEDFGAGSTGIITQHGYVTNEQWNWTQLPGTPLYLDAGGKMTTNPTQQNFMQRVGDIVTANTVRIDIQPSSRYVDKTLVDYKNVIPLVVDKVTGEELLAPDYYFSGIEIIEDILKDASKLPVTALGGPTHKLEEWTADFLATDDDLERRITILEELLSHSNADVDYIRPLPTPIGVGGAPAGTTFDGTVQDALDKILYPYGVPKFNTFVIRGATAVIEVGVTFLGGTRTFDWTTQYPDNIAPNTIKIVDTTAGVTLAEGLANSGTTTAQLSDVRRQVPGSYTWTISATTTQASPLSRAYSIEWRWKVYYGNSEKETLSGADVVALASSSLPSAVAGTYVTPASGYKWLCYPSTFPTVKSFKDQATGLNIAINDPIEVSVTSAQGITQTYKCHRTFNKLGGALTMVVS